VSRFPHALAPAAALAMALAAAAAAHGAAPGGTPGHGARLDLSRPEVVDFIDSVVRHDGLRPRDVRRLLARARIDPSVIARISQPIEQVLPWWQYRSHFVTPARIEGGVRLWRGQRGLLTRIAAEHGVPPQYILAILGCETFYGRITGSDRVLDALATLAFDYPPRAPYFRGELEQFLLLAREAHLNPLTVEGSYAGAMGAPQFMPSSYRRYAVPPTARRVDLWHDWSDIFAAVARYLQLNGWDRGEPVLAEASVDAGANPGTPPLALTDTLESLAARGIHAATGLRPDTPAMLVPAETPAGPGWRVGFNNFYVITTYNHSARYAMAVSDLADAIAAAMGGAAMASPGPPSAPQAAAPAAAPPGPPSARPVAAPAATPPRPTPAPGRT